MTFNQYLERAENEWTNRTYWSNPRVLEQLGQCVWQEGQGRQQERGCFQNRSEIRSTDCRQEDHDSQACRRENYRQENHSREGARQNCPEEVSVARRRLRISAPGESKLLWPGLVQHAFRLVKRDSPRGGTRLLRGECA